MSGGLSETSPYSGSKLAISPGITGDLGIILGSTPGVSFIFGAMAWVELPSTSQVGAQTIGETPANGAPFNASVGPFTVETGPQVYIGPYLGMRFGH